MNIVQALEILLFGVGLGALLIWPQQAAARKQFRQELEAQIDQALIDGLHYQRLLNILSDAERVRKSWSLCDTQIESPASKFPSIN